MKSKKRFPTSRVGEDEKYFCLECKKQQDISKVDEDKWTCLDCNEKIIIFSDITNSYIIRIYAANVKWSNRIFNYSEGKWVEVLGASEYEYDDDFVYLGLKEHGGHITEWDDLVDCYISFTTDWSEMELFEE
ncbi:MULTISPECIES: hypothetical protein [unclassified Lysinibacillus]|uniref:hypothetical protein n=1 Tax=unclassified Lysinibacillus TaxID=2636778 RepID=UPI000884A5F6|nr:MULTISPECIES: hypothetical protein [unclassified Lysinibacillus]SCY98864.1 hypothetical protein SAMN02787078_03427 [Lysinibacillus sp. SG9]SDB47207.1 hypothetical protein SAMN02787079_03636 [Lysinibacillus sp. TC-37]SFT12179.1 hypothetical protein SAMN02787087_03729 [Lysinibacillus sp. SG55]